MISDILSSTHRCHDDDDDVTVDVISDPRKPASQPIEAPDDDTVSAAGDVVTSSVVLFMISLLSTSNDVSDNLSLTTLLGARKAD